MSIETDSTPMTGSATAETRERVRDRILNAAADLFYRLGIRAVGVEAIAAEAGTTKMSLYRHFNSKDELVAEWLRSMNDEFLVWWDSVVEPFKGEPRKQIEAVFASFESRACDEDTGRGCPLVNATVEITDPEHPAHAVMRAHHVEVHRRVQALCEELGARDPERLADALTLVMFGTHIARLVFDVAGPLQSVSEAARILLDSSTLGTATASRTSGR